MIKKFSTYNINERTDVKGLEINNEYTNLINDDNINVIDLGYVDDVSQTDITNIQQKYKKSQIKEVDGHYLLLIDEQTIIKYSDFLNEDGFGEFVRKFKKIQITDKTKDILHRDITGIPQEIGISELKYNQILYKFDNGGYESLSKEDKKIFDKMVYYANLVAQDENKK